MRPGHGRHIDRFAIFIMMLATVTLVVPEAVLDANNDPVESE